jgi:hypothetical protein
MSEPTAVAPPAAPAKPRRRRWLLVLVALLLLGAGAGVLFLRPDPSVADLRAAFAEADRLDPGWRFEELDARRKVIPDEDNAALPALAARKLLPASWPSQPPPAAAGAPGPFPPGVEERLSDLPPEVRLDEALARDLGAELALVEPALAEARRLKGLSEGRFPVAWTPDVIGTKLDSLEVRPVASLLEWEAAAQAEEGRPGAALATGRGVLVVGRSIGDEPLLISLMLRLNVRAQAVRSIERTLAQGLPPAAELKAAQELFEDEEAQPLLLNGLRGERGVMGRLTELMQDRTSGRLSQAVRSGPGGLRGLLDLNKRRRAREMFASALRADTEVIEVAKMPLEDQARHFALLRPAEATGEDDIGVSMTRTCIRTAETYRRSQAILRCALVGLALERYRDEKGRWPDRLDELAPAYLKPVPLDPFDGRPLRFKRLPDGVLVYSVGPDEQDDGGALNRKDSRAKGTDLGFRLWDADRRRQPPAEVLPPPEPR